MQNSTATTMEASVIGAGTESNWKGLYKMGGIAALISRLLFPIQIAIFFTNPYPASVSGWFALLTASPLVGLVELDLFLLIDSVLVIFIFAALFVALKENDWSVTLASALLGIMAAVLFIASNPAFSMLSLSGQFAASLTDAERSSILAAGQAVMSLWDGSAWATAYFIGSVAPIAISLVMLRSPLFRKATAYLGIGSNFIALGMFVPVIGIYISLFSVMILWVWYLLIALDLFKLSSNRAKVAQ